MICQLQMIFSYGYLYSITDMLFSYGYFYSAADMMFSYGNDIQLLI